MMQPFPSPDFIPTQSAVEGIEVFRPAPPKDQDHRETVHFACPQCGATTAYSASNGGLTCTHCGYYEPPEKEMVGKGAERFEFTVETLDRAAHGWGEARKELQCQGCGAYTSIPVDSLTHTCAFCGSNKVIQRQASQDVLRPRFLIPFKLEADKCHTIAREWLGSSWMTPGPLKRLAQVANFTGIYIPFWTFGAITQASWKAEVGHKKSYTDSQGKTRTKIVWKWESGRVQLGLHDILIEGTTRLSTILLGGIKQYNLHKLAPYEPKYLAGFQAQSFDVPLEAAWELGRHEMRERTRHACRSQASTNRIRNFSMELDFGDETWRYILLPVYIAVYTYEAKTYQVMVNGQTGAIAGQRPVDWMKVWLALAALVAPGLTVGFVGVILLLLGGIGFPIMVVGFILLVIGLIVGFYLVQKAQKMDDA